MKPVIKQLATVESISPLDFRVFENNENFEVVYNLRSLCLSGDGKYIKEDLESEFDNYSTHIVSYYNDEPIGALSLVLGEKLPVSNYIDNTQITPLSCELKKLCILNVTRADEDEVFYGLLNSAYIYLVQKKFQNIFIATSKLKARSDDLFKTLGFIRIGEYIEPRLGKMKVLFNQLPSISLFEMDHIDQKNMISSLGLTYRMRTQGADLLNEVIENINVLMKDESEDLKKMTIEYFEKDLMEYLSVLDSLEKLIDQNVVESSFVENVLIYANNYIASKGEALTNLLEAKRLKKTIKLHFKQLIAFWVNQSKLMLRGLSKPKGYPGDYLMLEMVYNFEALSKGIGYYFDKYFLLDSLAIAVRNRKDMTRDILLETIRKAPHDSVKILNLACGASREIRELIPELKLINKKISFTLVDLEKEALKYSKEALADVSDNVKIDYIEGDLGEVVKSDVLLKQFSGQDLVYSIGLADYLPDKLLKNLIAFSCNILSPTGRFYIAHKDYTKYKPLPEDWFCDWRFIPRVESEMIELCQQATNNQFEVNVQREESQVIYFLCLSKK